MSVLASVLVLLSQVGGSLSVLSLSCLSHSYIDALQPLFSMFLILSFQHICLTVSEDLEGPWQAPIAALLCHYLQTQRGTMSEKEMAQNWKFKVYCEMMPLGSLHI